MWGGDIVTEVRGTLRLLSISNAILRRGNLRLTQIRPTNWDAAFRQWVRRASAEGEDPNDVGDADWNDDRLDLGLRQWYLDGLTEQSTVVELGPGTGRLTRHLIGRCRRLVLLDASPVVCNWLNGYLTGKGTYSIQQITGTRTSLEAASVDRVVAHGVVEHLDQEVLFGFLREFARILRPGGTFVFTFDSLVSGFAANYLDDGDNALHPGRFRFYHPEAIRELGAMNGFSVEVFADGDRIAFARMTKD